MPFTNRIVAYFSLATSALFGASVVLLYDQFGRDGAARHTQVTARLASSATSKTPLEEVESGGVLDMPIVLPPSVKRSAEPAVTEAFQRECMEASALGLPSSGEVRCYGAYVASLNYERRLPNWVLERLPADAGGEKKADGSDGGCRTNSKFFADPTVPPPFRVAPENYTTRGLSRGHLAAARFHKHSQAEMDSTFNMNANMVPQDMTVNALDWERLESLTSRLSREVASGPRGKKHAQAGTGSNAAGPAATQGHLYVVSGPVFMPQAVQTVERWANGTTVQALTPLSPQSSPALTSQRRVVQYELTGKHAHSLVAVPTHLFKVLLAEKRVGGSGPATYEAAAFLVPNQPIAEEKPLTDYQVPLALVESVTGLTLFPHLGAQRRSALANLCASHRCESRPAGLFAKYRDVAQLRAATSVPELRQTYAALEVRNKTNGGNSSLDAMVVNELHKRTEELVAESVRGVESR